MLGRRDIYGNQRFAYVLDLTKPDGMFQARDFVIRDGDTVYVTEAPFTQWQKVHELDPRHRGRVGTVNRSFQ